MPTIYQARTNGNLIYLPDKGVFIQRGGEVKALDDHLPPEEHMQRDKGYVPFDVSEEEVALLKKAASLNEEMKRAHEEVTELFRREPRGEVFQEVQRRVEEGDPEGAYEVANRNRLTTNGSRQLPYQVVAEMYSHFRDTDPERARDVAQRFDPAEDPNGRLIDGLEHRLEAYHLQRLEEEGRIRPPTT